MPLTPQHVVDKKFKANKFSSKGYDEVEVDDFLDEVADTLRVMQQENDELRTKLSACESRVGELSRAAGASDPVVAEQELLEPQPGVSPTAVPVAHSVPAQPVPAQAGPEQAAGMLALAQKLHDQHVRSGEDQRDQLVSEAKEQAERLVREAEAKKSQTLGALERERSLLERKIDDLRGFEREYRTRLKSYLEAQLKDLEAKGSMAPAKSPDPSVSLGS